MTGFHSQQEKINKLLNAVYPAFSLHAGLELDLFSILANKPKSAEAIARETNAHHHKLQPLLFALVNAGLLIHENNQFSNTSLANHFLVKGQPDYIGGRTGLRAGNWKRMLEMSTIIRSGKPEVAYDDPSSREELIAVFSGLYPGAVKDGNYLINYADFTQHKKLLDIGGGSGGLAITITQANPHLKSTVIDLPSVTPITKHFVEEANAKNQIEIIAANALHDQISGSYDAVVARHLIQVLSKENAQIILKKINGIMEPGGTLYIIGYILDDSRLAPLEAVNFNLVFITSTEYGEAYTEREYTTWLEIAGFVDYRRDLLPDGSSILTIRKPEKKS